MSESAKYAGYVRRDTPIDWSQVASDVVDKLGDIEKDKAAFREKNDKLAADAIAKVSEYEAGQNPELNQLAYDMIADGRSTISSLHDKLKRREISPDAYNRALMSMQEQNASFQNILTTYNTDLERINKGLDDGTLGAGSQWMVDKLADLSDLRDKKFQWVPNKNGITNLYITSVDEDGNMTKEPMSLGSVRDLGKTDFVKYDLAGDVNKLVKSMEVYTDPSGRIRDVRQNDEYKDAKQATINAALATDNQVLSILTDYGDYTIYGEGDEVPSERGVIPDYETNEFVEGDINKGVKMVLNRNGQYVPEITPELRKKAAEIVDKNIEGRVGRIVTPYTPRRGDDKDPSGYNQAQIGRFRKGYDVTWEAAMGESFEGMSDQYEFMVVEDGINVYKLSDSGKRGRKVNDKPLPLGKAKTAEYLSKYTKEFGSSEQQGKWDVIHKKEARQDVDLVTVGEDVGVKAYSPSVEDYKILTDNETNLYSLVDAGQDQASLDKSKGAIKQFIQSKAPRAKIEFKSENKTSNADDYTETTIIINGEEVPTKILHEKMSGPLSKVKYDKDEFVKAIKEAVNIGRKKKRFIAQAPGQNPPVKRKTIAEIMAANPGMSVSEATEIFKNQS